MDENYEDEAGLAAFKSALTSVPSQTISSQSDWAPVSVGSLDGTLLSHQHKNGSAAASLNSPSSRLRRFRRKKSKKKNDAKYKEPIPDDVTGLTYKVLRFPIFIFIFAWIALLTVCYAVVRFYVASYEKYFTWTGRRQELRRHLQTADNYQDWQRAAAELDEFLGRNSWKADERSTFYDYRTVSRLVKTLRNYRSRNQVEELAAALQGCVKYNFAGTQNPLLYSQAYLGTKDLMETYNSEVAKSIEFISDSSDIPDSQKKLIFKNMSRNFGKSALCLSGGACFAYRHFGVVRALLDNDALPTIVSGTSGGSLVAALVCTRTDDELREVLNPQLADKINCCAEKFPDWLVRWYKSGARFDSVDWARQAMWFTRGSMTFRECYERTGKILNVSMVPSDASSPALLCNYITSPDCVIWSALLASAAVPGILNPVVLMMKSRTGKLVPFHFGAKWKDGSLRTDIPIQQLNMFFNVNFTIVSQVNPHVALFVYSPRGTVGRPVSHRRGQGWRGGFLGSSLENIIRLEIRKWLQITRSLKLIPKFGGHDWSNVWLQKFNGSVTLWPKIKLTDFWYILADPTREQLESMMFSGAQSTFPKLVFIRHALTIERAISHARDNLKSATGSGMSSDSLMSAGYADSTDSE